MSIAPRPPIPQLVPESAPFTPEQRTWLNGFFAGLMSLDGAVTPLSAAESAALMPMPPAARHGIEEAGEDDDGAPWHDQTLPLTERMTLAEGRPLRRRMMAAMAQQDCGQCGYNCQDYSNALFLRKEERLNLCVPGGKETARMLKTLYQELGQPTASATPIAAPIATPTAASAKSAPSADVTAAPAAAPGRSRDNPAAAVILSRTRLNKPGSAKETWHLEFDLAGSGIDYSVGDAFGIFPANDPALVDAVLAALAAPADFPIGGRSLRDVLIDSVSLSPAPDVLFELLSYITGGERRQKAKTLAAGGDPDGDAATLDVLAAVQKFRGVRPDPEAFIEALDPLQPRLYSIASSPKVDPKRIALTVDAVRYPVDGRTRLGVASTHLAERASPGDRIKVYVQKAQHFCLPADPSVPIIMIGPGTGVAPFRAFLHERMATSAPGRNWLFFGHQRSNYDFFYEDEFAGMKAKRVLTRLTLAWSRDSEQKIYVQDRMREVGRDLWAWLAEGAHVYVCGDAKHMAKDVERALIDVVASYGMRSANEAVAFVADLKKSGRYQQDVY
jgi:sulfite reductase (NADPH) flavoprotein alpha-component